MERKDAVQKGWGRCLLTRAVTLGAGIFLVLAPSGPVLAAAEHAHIQEFTPLGRVSAVESVQVRFPESVAAFGDTTAASPVQLECRGLVPGGQGRWLDDRHWVYAFDAPLNPGVQCVALADPAFRDLHGRALPAGLRFEFDTGAPSVTDMRPYASTTIDEEQIFILRFNAPVDAESVAHRSHCEVDGLGERIPVRPASHSLLQDLLQASYMEAPSDPRTVALLQCARVLPPETRMSLVVGPDVRALQQPSGLAGSEQAQTWEFQVRPPFVAKLRCTRERAGRPCIPMAPIVLEWTAPVPREVLAGLTLEADGQRFAPEESADDDPSFVDFLRFPGPFPASTTLTLTLPEGLRDDAGRPLENADRFPLEIKVGEAPPLAKFASGTFGVIERFAQGRPGTEREEAAVPVSLRHVEADLTTRGLTWSAGRVASLREVNDAEVLRWYARLQRLDSGRWSEAQVEDIFAGRAPRDSNENWEDRLDARAVSLLGKVVEAVRLELPKPPEGESRPFEMIGVPLSEPGFHVLEIESPRLGASLLEDGGPMYVRTGVLLTNLSVHVKRGRDDLLVWVTTLADASPVADADITVLDCEGRPQARGRSNAEGIWHHLGSLDTPDYCPDTGLSGFFVSARVGAEHPQAHGKADYSFVMSTWDRGIESWRFNIPTDGRQEPVQLSHTVFDRNLFRTGETVFMKHYLREQTRDGLRNPVGRRPDRLVIEHEGSSQRHEREVAWQETPSGGLVAINEFQLPESAHLGSYSVRLTDADQNWYGSSTFRVEAFRLPLLTGQLTVRSEGRPDVLVAPDSLTLDMQLAWISGGPASGQPVQLSAVAEDRGVVFAGYDDYSFAPATPEGEQTASEETPLREDSGPRREVFADAVEVRLDGHGSASIALDRLPVVDRPRRFLFEASFADPNGEIQTLSQSADVWPAGVQVGIKAPGWHARTEAFPVEVVALDTDGKPRQGVPVQLQSVERKTYSVRTRMVGGFYRYESHMERLAPVTLCTGKTDERGVFACDVHFEREGSYELQALGSDDEGRQSTAQGLIWVSGAADMWFPGAADDRIDLIPAKREWAVGEEAEFQVRMPFREALALVSVEREGVLWARLQPLKGSNPLVRVPVRKEWGPNAFVSVLVLRGRLYELPWQSFFSWGWRQPDAWLNAWKSQRDDTWVTQHVDLAKPAFRLGIAELKVAGESDRLQVVLTPEKDTLQVREETMARVRVTLPDGAPASHGTVAFAVVDEALLELAPNESWALYEAMHPRRSLHVSTASNQLEVVGRRHYGRKAVAAGGGGGHLPTRQLFDTLLTWQPLVALDANGEAQLRFRMNDSLSRFRMVALADHGAGGFGRAEASVVSHQPLQLVSGLPPVVREGDQYRAQVTVRNGSRVERNIRVHAVADPKDDLHLPPQTVRLAPGESGTVHWQVEAPALRWPDESRPLTWRFEASDGEVTDRLQFIQRVDARVPVSTVQATLLDLEAGKPAHIPVSAPAQALRDSEDRVAGGLQISVSPTLLGSQTGVRDWWEAYPYTCLEQSASQAIALHDRQRWEKVVARLSTHMDEAGFLKFFPVTGPGSEVLTAYVLSVSHEAQTLGDEWSLPAVAREPMLEALQAFAEGRVEPKHRAPVASLDARRLMAMEALARYGRLAPDMLDTLSTTPDQWSTASVVDWVSILKRLPTRATRQEELSTARQILMSRMTVSGNHMVFADRALNAAPELMATRVTSLARLLLAVADDPQWRDDLPRMVRGLMSQQTGGAWTTTTENLLAPLALARYENVFEPVAARGTVHAGLGEQQFELPVSPSMDGAEARLRWPPAEAQLALSHQGNGRAWVNLRAQAPIQAQDASTGYRLERRVVPVRKAHPQVWSRGDIYRVEITLHARDSGTWVVLDDPVPAGASILGSGLGRDATANVQTPAAGPNDTPTFVERTASAYRAYFEYLPVGRVTLAYTVRLNAAGNFGLPPTRVEALYQPDLRGSLSHNERFVVEEGRLDAPVGPNP